MVPRRVLLERLLDGFPVDRIRCNCRAVNVVPTREGVRVDFGDGSIADADVLIGADGLHSTVREVVGAPHAVATGWCSWQGMVRLAGLADTHVAVMMIGEHGDLGLWPVGAPRCSGGSTCRGRRSSSDRKLRSTCSGPTSAGGPRWPFGHPIARTGQGAITLLGDAAHTMPPTLAQGINQALLDTMVLRKALSRLGGDNRNGDLACALRWYEHSRRRTVKAVSWLTTQQVSRSESVLRPAALIPDRLHTWALTTLLRSLSHHRMSAAISRELETATTAPSRQPR